MTGNNEEMLIHWLVNLIPLHLMFIPRQVILILCGVMLIPWQVILIP
ncbi:MAG: hypothetical protein ACYC4T_07095 [Melioribacteraceae bacterium]